MSTEAKVIARTVEVDPANFNPIEFSHNMKLLGGKMAGICYGSDEYTSEAINNEEKAIERAENNRNSGHHSVFEHGYATLILKTNKMIAMVLNSCGVYTTSEKSARYTEMKPESDLEKEYYQKWITKLEPIIKAYLGEIKTDKEIHKLAMENARYMISVFTPTYMAYTISFRQACNICNFIDKFVKDVYETYSDSCFGNNNIFINRLIDELKNLKWTLINTLKLNLSGNITDGVFLGNHKNEGFRFFDFVNDKKESIADSYTLKYKCSLACLAQLQRHRTIRYSFDFPGMIKKMSSTTNTSEAIFIPKIIRDSYLEKEWVHDALELLSHNVPIQALQVNVAEQGIVEDFVLKCKERLCSRAQYEICEVTIRMVERFKFGAASLSYSNTKLIKSMMNIEDSFYLGEVVPKCVFMGGCKEPCVHGKNGLCRNI